MERRSAVQHIDSGAIAVALAPAALQHLQPAAPPAADAAHLFYGLKVRDTFWITDGDGYFGSEPHEMIVVRRTDTPTNFTLDTRSRNMDHPLAFVRHMTFSYNLPLP